MDIGGNYRHPPYVNLLLSTVLSSAPTPYPPHIYSLHLRPPEVSSIIPRCSRIGWLAIDFWQSNYCPFVGNMSFSLWLLSKFLLVFDVR